MPKPKKICKLIHFLNRCLSRARRLRAMTQYSRNLIRLTCLPLCHSLLQTAGNLISQFFRNAIFSYFFLTSAFHFLEAEVRKDSHSLYSRHSCQSRHSVLKTAGNITRCTTKTKTKSAMLPTSLMLFLIINDLSFHWKLQGESKKYFCKGRESREVENTFARREVRH